MLGREDPQRRGMAWPCRPGERCSPATSALPATCPTAVRGSSGGTCRERAAGAGRVSCSSALCGPQESKVYNRRMAGEMRIPGWATYVALAVLDGALLNFGRQEHCCQEAVVVSCVRYKMAAWAWGVLDAANARSIVARARAPAARRRCAHGKGPWKRAGAWAAGSGAERVPRCRGAGTTLVGLLF